MHANILPFQHQYNHATLRMATLHTTHSLRKGIATAYRFVAKRNFQDHKHHSSPIHKPFNELITNPATTETTQPIRLYPEWITDVDTHIAETKEKAYKDDEMASEKLRVYSDGSMIDGGVGGAAVLMKGERIIRELRFYLGSADKYTVYEGEVVGMILAVKLLRDEITARGGRRITMALGVDCQEAIRATGPFQSKPGHYLMDNFLNELHTLLLYDNNKKLIIRWSAGHIGIPGNKQADEQAKRAARGEMSKTRLLPASLRSPNNTPITLPVSKPTAPKRTINKISCKKASRSANMNLSEGKRNVDKSFE